MPTINKAKFQFTDGLIAICVYLIILAAHGYVFGHNDQIEVLPYALFLQDPTLYPTDFFIQEISKFVPNERILFVWMFVPFVKILPLFCGLMHAVSSLSLLLGLFAIGQLFIKNKYLIWGALLCCFLPFYNINLGGNELYYNMFISSFAAKAILIWAIYFFLTNHYKAAFLLLIPATLLHPVAGAQIFLLLCGVALTGKILQWVSIDLKQFAILVALFLCTAGLWVFYLHLNLGNATLDPKLFLDIIEFRISHHYFPSWFPLKHYLLLGVLFCFGLVYFYKNNKKLFLFFLLAMIGMMVYTFAIELLENTVILSAQWFKSSIWLEAFSLLALFAFLENRLAFLHNNVFSKLAFGGIYALTLLALFIFVKPFSVFQKRPYDFAFKNEISAEQEIALQAKNSTAKDAVFIVPPDNSAFKFFSQRSSFIEYKTVVHRKDALPKWYNRIRQVYGVGIADKKAGKDITQLARSNYRALQENKISGFQEMGVDYFLTYKTHSLDFPIVCSNEIYIIYKIPKRLSE